MAKVVLDTVGVGEVLKGPLMAAAMAEMAGRIAGNVSSTVPVTVSRFVTDRAGASVSLASPRGLSIEARTGALRRAAASVGLEVHDR